MTDPSSLYHEEQYPDAYWDGYADGQNEMDPIWKMAVQKFHEQYHTEGSYQFHKCWEEPCKDIKSRI
jgi:hypothetical protein